MKEAKKNSYQDILNEKRPLSRRHARMSMAGRGAQFAPFAALTGFEGVLRETIHQTQQEHTLEPDREEELDWLL